MPSRSEGPMDEITLSPDVVIGAKRRGRETRSPSLVNAVEFVTVIACVHSVAMPLPHQARKVTTWRSLLSERSVIQALLRRSG